MRFLVFILLTACSFSSLHQNELFFNNNIKIKVHFNNVNLPLQDKIIYNNIEAEIGAKYLDDNPNYILVLNNLSHNSYVSVIDREGNVSEYNYHIILNARLYDSDCYLNNDNKNNCNFLFSKNFSDSINYNIKANYYASEIVKENIRSDLTKSLANEILTEILFSLN
jgi:hypothetical protein